MPLAIEQQKDIRTRHLERLAAKYPDVPMEVIVKEDVGREGLMVSKALLAHVGEKSIDTQHHFSWHIADPTQMEAALGDRTALLKMPSHTTLLGGPYGLRPTDIAPRLNAASPYLVDIVEGKPRLLDRQTRELIADLWDYWQIRTLEYLDKVFDDGTPYVQVLTEGAALSTFRQCQHWGRDEECRYCDINETARVKKQLGELKFIAPKDPAKVAEAAFYLFQIEDWPQKRADFFEWPRHIHITGGTVTTQVQGMREDQFYLRYVEALRDKLGGRVDIDLQTHPWPKEQELEAKRRGVTTRISNFEVWDPDLFRIICPGKARFIGREEWIRRVLGQVDIFGVGHVCPGFVAGVEMAQPWGFKTVEEAVRSTTEGMEFFMSHGVVVRPISWCVEGLSALAGQVPPPVDYFIQIDRNWFELFMKYDLPPDRYAQIGPGSRCYVNNAAQDMGERAISRHQFQRAA